MVYAHRVACPDTPLTRRPCHITGVQRLQSSQFRFRRRPFRGDRQLRSGAQLQGAQQWPEAQCLEEIYEQLAARLCDTAEQKAPPQKHLIGIAGVPGSGKSTAASHISSSINSLWKKRHGKDEDCASCLPMDGFHLSQRQLNVLPNPEEAYARRGAPWTFNAGAFYQAILHLREAGEGLFPTFDHAVGDPREAEIHIEPHHRIVLIEGNYVLLDEEPWCGVRKMLDEAWYIDSDLEVAMERVFARQTGNGAPPEVVQRRIDTNDRPNALQISATKEHAHLVIPALPLCGKA